MQYCPFDTLPVTILSLYYTLVVTILICLNKCTRKSRKHLQRPQGVSSYVLVYFSNCLEVQKNWISRICENIHVVTFINNWSWLFLTVYYIFIITKVITIFVRKIFQKMTLFCENLRAISFDFNIIQDQNGSNSSWKSFHVDFEDFIKTH